MIYEIPNPEKIVYLRVALAMFLLFALIAFAVVGYYFVFKPVTDRIDTADNTITTNLASDNNPDLAGLDADSMAVGPQLQASINGTFAPVTAAQAAEMLQGLADLQAQNQTVQVLVNGPSGPYLCNILVSVKAEIDTMLAAFVASANATIVDITSISTQIAAVMSQAALYIDCQTLAFLLDPSCGNVPETKANIMFNFGGGRGLDRVNYCCDCVPLGFDFFTTAQCDPDYPVCPPP